MKFYKKILDAKRLNLLKKFGFLKRQGFYLAGGTALALQIGHRISLDFDFYTEKSFDSRKLRKEFDKIFKEVREIYIEEDTLNLEVEKIGISFFKYSYNLIRSCQELEEVNLASLEDIAAMKILAISQRGKGRDFIDIYFLIKKFGLEKIIDFTKEKYPMFNIYIGFQGLTYFKDADENKEKSRCKMIEKIDWREIKNYLIKEVDKYRLHL